MRRNKITIPEQAASKITSKSKLVASSLALLFSLFSTFVVADISNMETQSPGHEFNHFETGFPLTGAHLTTECGSCHVAGVFKGTPRNC
ncbi:MAG: hypothetical protein ACM3W8_03845, partial [Sideroxydans sp.]